MKEEIRYHAIRLFDKKGFHGTSMRDIADAVGCKTPTVYHHYKNKENLYDEVVRVAYINLINTKNRLLPEKITPQDYCAESIIQKKHLSDDEMLIHRIALKTWLGCEGCDEVRQKLIEWENARNARNEESLSNIVSSITWAKIITRVFMNLMERIILFGEDIADEEIRKEINMIFDAATHSNKTLQMYYAAALADATLRYGKAGILDEVKVQKRAEQMQTGSVLADRFGVKTPKEAFERIQDTYGCANWVCEDTDDGFIATCTSCMLSAISKKMGNYCPCQLHCLSPIEAMIKGVQSNAEFTIEKTLWNEDKCLVKVSLR